jgi:hypothetical protein
MPIAPEWRSYYGQEWRESVRPRIMTRAHNKCEQCGKPDGKRIWVMSLGMAGQFWSASRVVPKWHVCLRGGAVAVLEKADVIREEAVDWAGVRQIRVVLTVAHLNHDPTDNRDSNLRALCQWCHLHHDARHHKDTRSRRKDGARPLLAALA